MKVSRTAESWTIGDLAGKVGLPTHVLRHWESLGLLEPKRDASGYRRYGRDDLVRVVAIQRNKTAGMTLDQIGALLDAGAAGRHEVLTAHLKDIEDRIQALERSRAMTEHAMACRAHDIAACPRFAALVADLVEGRISALPRHDAAGRPIDH
jgi:MerR family copper efflux transcriptional regulator